MNLDRIYQPIVDDLKKVERFLEFSVKESKNRKQNMNLINLRTQIIKKVLIISLTILPKNLFNSWV